MQLEPCEHRRAEAIAEFNQLFHRQDGSNIADSLANGLMTLSDQLFTRIHEDVQQEFGVDSMLIPTSTFKSQQQTIAEIEVFQAAESAAEVKKRNFVASSAQWYAHWLATLRLGDVMQDISYQLRLGSYLEQNEDQRRLLFSQSLENAFPQSSKAPLVLFRLFPLAVRIVTAIAFGDHFAATDGRNQQLILQSAISDCHECHGRVLDNGERCRICGNPLWTYKWLTVID